MKFFPLFLLALCTLPLGQAAEKPNVIFIMVDDLGYGDLSLYGAPDLKSPNIDQLMSDGMRFDRFYANCPVCTPTRASFITGLYPDMAGAPGVIRTLMPDRATSFGNLRDDVPTLPTVMSQAGYHTALVGKWHLGLEKPDRPNDKGFDYFHGFLGDMMDDYYDHLRHGNHYMREDETPVHPEGHATDIFSDWAIDYVTDRTKHHADQPFFLFLAYNAPHTPIQPPTDWLEKVKAREEGITDQRAALVALIEHMDAGIGRVRDAVNALGIAEDTLIVFTSDNGGQSNVAARNLPWRGGKQEMWEGGIRVGTSVTWPGTIEAGVVNEELLSLTMDFYPTLAEIAGASIDHEIDGRSFVPVLLGQPFNDPERTVFWVRLEGNQKYGALAYHAAQRGDYKLLRNTPFEPYQLFNLGSDPQQIQAIPRNAAPKKYDELFNALMLHIQRAGAIPWQ